MIKVIVFDFDDTLVKSEEIKRQTFSKIFASSPETEKIAQEYVLQNSGKPRREMIQGILTALGKKEDELEEYLEKFSQEVEEAIMAAPEMPGAEEALEELSKNYPLYLNSATPREALVKIIERKNWQRFFKSIYGAPPGTKIEHLGEIIAQAGISPEEVLAVGDGEDDLNATLSLGCKFVGINSGNYKFDGASFPVLADLRNFPHVVNFS